MGLRWPLSRGSQFKFHFYLGWLENRGSRQGFHSPLFEGSLINNDELRDNSIRTKCMAIQVWLKNYDKLGNQNTYVPKLFDKPSLSTKIILKKPLSRGSRFKIHFRLERRGNRGSCRNFHGIPFPKTVY